MRIRNFALHPRPRSALTLELASRRATLLAPDPSGRPIAVELDLAVALEDGQAAIITASPNLLARGLTPAAGAILVTAPEPLAVLRLWVNPPNTPIELPAGTTIARLLLLEAAAVPLFDDPTLDDLLDPEPPSPFVQFQTHDVAAFRGGDEG